MRPLSRLAGNRVRIRMTSCGVPLAITSLPMHARTHLDIDDPVRFHHRSSALDEDQLAPLQDRAYSSVVSDQSRVIALM